jgi:L-alanine-DL-glutamate epimerase-like enolase superfamily enzyme
MRDLHGWRSVGDATHIRLAAGEQATALADPQPLLREAVLSYVLPDVKAAGACGAFDILIAAADAGGSADRSTTQLDRWPRRRACS